MHAAYFGVELIAHVGQELTQPMIRLVMHVHALVLVSVLDAT